MAPEWALQGEIEHRDNGERERKRENQRGDAMQVMAVAAGVEEREREAIEVETGQHRETRKLQSTASKSSLKP